MEATPRKKAVLVWISADDHLVTETEELCSAAGYDLVERLRQNRPGPDPRFYLGAGKAGEIALLDGIEHIIVPSDISPAQTYNLSTVAGKPVTDRIRLILEIFHTRANTPESRLQVELADLHHQLPIVREYVHQGKLSEKPGFMAGGEYRIDYYYDMIRKRMTSIRHELDEIKKRRGETRAKRRRRGVHLISVAGYTNAGKSTLMNALVEDTSPERSQETSPEVFTTLSTATRRVKGLRNCLITDTVGFISDLPPFLIQGFMSTLEEVFDADVVLLVVDGSEGIGTALGKLTDSLDILKEGEVRGTVIVVLNKMDRIADGRVELADAITEVLDTEVGSRVERVVQVSATTREGIDDLLDAISGSLPPIVELMALFPSDRSYSSLRRDLGGRYGISFRSSSAKGNVYLISADDRWEAALRERVAASGGTVLEEEGE